MRTLLALLAALLLLSGCGDKKEAMPYGTGETTGASKAAGMTVGAEKLIGAWHSGAEQLIFKPDGTFEKHLADVQSSAQIVVKGTFTVSGDTLKLEPTGHEIVGDAGSPANKSALGADAASLATPQALTVVWSGGRTSPDP